MTKCSDQRETKGHSENDCCVLQVITKPIRNMARCRLELATGLAKGLVRHQVDKNCDNSKNYLDCNKGDDDLFETFCMFARDRLLQEL